ncbi:MAG: Fic family protein [Clostridia bacterium]|nr:Fic family protein [Clostridia bacterium]
MLKGFGKYDIEAETQSIYCYKNTDVLKNRFGIKDKDKLRALESDLSAIRQNDMLSHPIPGRLTPHHLCAVHKALFGDLYPFAGHYRRENISKGSTLFLPYPDIHRKLSAALSDLREKGRSAIPFDALVSRSAVCFAELNYIHPFREGNGRATREFMRLWFLKNGYEIDWGQIDTAELLRAMELSVFDASVLEEPLIICLRRQLPI